MRILSALTFAAVIIAACGPFQNPPSPEYPCGPKGIVCANHMCCWRGDVCGYDGPWSRCPAGQCCFEGEDTMMAKKPYPQMAPADAKKGS